MAAIQSIAIANDVTLVLTIARSPFIIRKNNSIRMLIIKAHPDNAEGEEVTYTGTGKWIVYDVNGNATGDEYTAEPIPIRAGTFLAIPTDGNAVIAGTITVPGASVAEIITKT